MTGPSAMSMFAALLDRSVARIGELAADGRFFDRQEVVRLADIWDNNTWPLFAVALARPGWIRERRARTALRWMADLGPSRRALMIELAAAAGFRLEPVLGPAAPEAVHHRDVRGQVHPGLAPLTPAAAASVADDYDLSRAEPAAVQVERAGPRLSGRFTLVAPRRYARPSDHDDALVQVYLDDVRAARVDSSGGAGATLDSTPTGVVVRVGGSVHLHAASAAVGFADPSWHLSRAGRAADATTPPRRPAQRRKARSRPLGVAGDTPFVLHAAMVEIRNVRNAGVVGRIPLRELCDALAGAGSRILAAAAEPAPARERAFERLAGEWLGASPHLGRKMVKRFPEHPWRHPVRPAGTGTADRPSRAQLTLAGYAATSTSATIHLAVPDDDGRWGLQAVEFPRTTGFTVDTAAFTAPAEVTGTPGTSLALGDALAIQ